METESYEIDSYDEISRKRPLEEGHVYLAAKRSNAANKPSLKILIPNHFAGKLIGKGGSKINEIETKYNASIQVSPNKEFYPGTGERVVIISAEVDQIIEFCSSMIQDILVEDKSDRMSVSGFKIVTTNVAVGLVMGKAGSVIKVIQEESQAKINIAKQDGSAVPGERVLTITGSPEQQDKACSQIIKKLSAEPMKMSNNNIKYGSYVGGSSIGNGNMYNNAMNMGYGVNQQPTYQNYPSVKSDMPRYSMDAMNAPNNYSMSTDQKSSVKTTHMIQMEIPDVMVGAIVGKQGQTINEFTRNSGAKINFSMKDEFAPGTTDRILTIKGGKNEVQTAFMLIDHKVAQVEHEFNGHTFVRR